MLLSISYVLFVYADGVSPSLKVLSSSKYIDSTGALNVVGEVQNSNVTQTYHSVKVFGTFYDSNGKVVGDSGTDTHPSDLGPQMKAPFTVYLNAASIPIKDIANYTLLVTYQ